MKVAVIGAGSWGTALANVLAARGHELKLWSRSAELAETMRTGRRNPTYMAGIDLLSGVDPTPEMALAVSGAEIVFVAVPTHAMRSIALDLRPLIKTEVVIVSTAKGFEPKTNATMTDVLGEVLPNVNSICALSGPNIAHEIAQGMHAATVVASNNLTAAEFVRDACNGPQLRFYSSADVHGVEFGGALKNIVAIAAGVCDGLQLGDNAKAAIITRGLAEMSRLGVACGGHPLTFAGLTGLGDCVVTCMSPFSRNRGLGEAIARGKTVAEFLSASSMVVEGVNTCKVAVTLAQQMQVEMPIAAEVHAVLFENKPLLESLVDLMNRGPGDELTGVGLTAPDVRQAPRQT